MKVTFTSGSPNNFNEFEYFDIRHSSSDNTVIDLETKEILAGNGKDADGQGIYGYEGSGGKEAATYSGSNGCIYVCSAEIGSFANETPAYNISVEDWKSLINTTIEKIHKLKGYDYEQIINDAYEVDAENPEDIEAFIEKHDDWLDLDEDELEDSDNFICAVRESLDLCSPTSFIDENLYSFDVEAWVNDPSTTIWDMHIKIGNLMRDNGACGVEYYRKCFYEAYQDVMAGNPDYVAAIVRASHPEDKAIIVCFDLDSITIEKKIDLSKTKESKKERDLEP